MSESRFAVEVMTPEISECLQQIAFKNKYTWAYEPKNQPKYTEQERLIFRPLTHEITYSLSSYNIIVILNGIKDFAKIVEKLTAKPPIEVELGSYKGEISADGQKLVVDCQTIPFKQVEKAYQTMRDLQSRKGEK